MEGLVISFVLASVSLCRAAPASGSFAVEVGSPVSVQISNTAILPCFVSPSQSVESMEVRWYLGADQFDNPIIQYKGKVLDHPSYGGRVSFGLRGPASGGLKSGDVSLKLVNVTIQDAGEYNCYVSSSQDHGTSTVSLRVTETGSSPLLSVEWTEDDLVKVNCESEGWYPQPELIWADKNKVLPADHLKYSKSSNGLLSVRSWVLVPGSSEVSCSVGLSDEVNKEVRLSLDIPQHKESGSSAGWVAFGILLVGLAGAGAVAGTLYFKKRAEASRRGGDQVDGSDDCEESKKLLPKELKEPTSLSVASHHFENIGLVDTNNPLITMKGSMFRDAVGKEFPDGNRVTCLTAVRGTPGFSSGQHYWEVSLKRENIEPKTSWWIGVTDKSEIPQDASISPKPSNGFWFLSSLPGPGVNLQFSTNPDVVFCVQSRPKTVGVYLDYDEGKLSFYNVEEESLIGSLAAKFTGEVFPLFNPGKGDRSVMEVLQRPEPSLSDCVNMEVQQQNEKN